MARVSEAYDVQVQAEEAMHEINSALDRLADNAKEYRLHILWYEMTEMAKRADKIRLLYHKLDMQALRGEEVDVINASRENAHG